MCWPCFCLGDPEGNPKSRPGEEQSNAEQRLYYKALACVTRQAKVLNSKTSPTLCAVLVLMGGGAIGRLISISACVNFPPAPSSQNPAGASTSGVTLIASRLARTSTGTGVHRCTPSSAFQIHPNPMVVFSGASSTGTSFRFLCFLVTLHGGHVVNIYEPRGTTPK